MVENIQTMKTANVEKLLVEEFTENIDKVKMTKINLAEYENKYANKCKSSCTFYIVLTSIIFAINIGIGTFLFTTNT